ncbi:ABC transporter substrate-binding protein [Georgenia alba]|uniref:ABC transporter substrate-binding protein n=1 Tax=Georgenia alba TaxID=2233858 RepID=A0ABW2Q8J8_9MICO
MGTRPHRTTIGMIGVATALCLAACGGATGAGEDPSGGGEEAAGGLTPVTIGAIPTADAAVIELGDRQGFFEEEGLELTIDQGASGAAVVPAVVSGEYQAGFSATLSVFQGAEQGLPLAMIAVANASWGDPDRGQNDIIVNPGQFETAADLEGESVAVNSLGGYAELLGRASVEAAGGDPDAVEFVELPLPDQVQALETGNVSAFVAGEPFGTMALEQGMVSLANTHWDLSPEPFVMGAWFINREAAEADPELYGALQRAVERSLSHAAAHEEELRELTPDFTGISPEVAAVTPLSNFDAELTAEGLAPIADAARRYGMVGSEVDLESLIWRP